MPTNPEPHDRATTYAQQAMETMLVLRKHTAGCGQCKLDQRLCRTYAEYVRNFEREYSLWLAHRGSGGVVLTRPVGGRNGL